jgi:hypothetical protein
MSYGKPCYPIHEAMNALLDIINKIAEMEAKRFEKQMKNIEEMAKLNGSTKDSRS